MGYHRTGVPSLIGVAKEMCRLLGKFSPLIQTLYPDNAVLQAALVAASEACQALETQLLLVREYGD
jgi:hypothetical protein